MAVSHAGHSRAGSGARQRCDTPRRRKRGVGYQRYHDAGAAAGVRPALILGLTRRRREARCAASPPLSRSQPQSWPWPR
jgi:hypothetical protein